MAAHLEPSRRLGKSYSGVWAYFTRPDAENLAGVRIAGVRKGQRTERSTASAPTNL